MIKKRTKYILITLTIFSILLTGCVPNYVPEDYEKEAIAKGKEIIRDYLSKENISYESDDVTLITGTAVGGTFGDYPTDYVKGIYKSGEEKYTVYANVNTGETFSDVNLELVNKALTDSLSAVFAESLSHGTNIVSNYSIGRQILSKDMPTTNENAPCVDVIEEIFGVIPSDIDSGNVREYVNDIADKDEGYSFDIYTSDDISRIDNTFFQKIKDLYPGVHAIYVYVINKFSMNSLFSTGHLDNGYHMTIKGEYHYFSEGNQLTYLHYNDCVSGKYGLHYIDYKDDNGTVTNYNPTLVRDVENPNVVYINRPKYGISFFYFTEDPGDCRIKHYYKDGKSKKYKNAQKMKLKKFDNGMVSVYIDDVLDFDEEGFPVSSDISIKLKY